MDVMLISVCCFMLYRHQNTKVYELYHLNGQKIEEVKLYQIEESFRMHYILYEKFFKVN